MPCSIFIEGSDVGLPDTTSIRGDENQKKRRVAGDAHDVLDTTSIWGDENRKKRRVGGLGFADECAVDLEEDSDDGGTVCGEEDNTDENAQDEDDDSLSNRCWPDTGGKSEGHNSGGASKKI